MSGKYFILDVNVIIHSVEISDEKNNQTVIVLAIKRSNNSAKQLADFFSKYIHNQEKIILVDQEVFDRKGDEKLPKNDKYLVQLSRATNAMLITSDLDLIEDLSPDENLYSAKFDIKVCTPRELIIEIDKDECKKMCS